MYVLHSSVLLRCHQVLFAEEYFESLDSAEASFSAKSSRKPVEDCQTFLIVGGVLGLLLFAASVAMCALSHRLYKVTHR